MRLAVVLLCIGLSATSVAHARGALRPKSREKAQTLDQSEGLPPVHEKFVDDFFLDAEMSVLITQVWDKTADQWDQTFKRDLQNLLRTTRLEKLPFGADANALQELNQTSAQIWQTLVVNCGNDFSKARRAYYLGDFCGPGAGSQEIAKDLGGLKASLASFLRTTAIEGPALFQTFTLPRRSLGFHPLFIQVLTEQLAEFKIYLTLDGQKQVDEYAQIQMISTKDYYWEKFKQTASDLDLQKEGTAIPIFTGPKELRNTMLLLSLHSAFYCEGWGIFPYANYSVIQRASVFGVSEIVGFNENQSKKIRDGMRMGLGDLREIGQDFVYPSIRKDCGEMPEHSFGYQHSSLIAAKYRKIWKR
jgi:hypothetical protein